jgi:uncharacterized protein with GYD domain
LRRVETMYLAMRIYRDETPDVVAEAKKRQDSLRQTLSQVPGFVHYYLLDTGQGSLAAVTVCQDKAGVEESVRVAAAWVRANMAQWAPNPPTVVIGEVVVEAAK